MRHHEGFYHTGKPTTSYHHQKPSLFLIKGRNSCELWMSTIFEATIAPPQHKIIVAYRNSQIIGFAIEIDWWSTIAIPRDNKLCYFCSYNVVENWNMFCAEVVPLQFYYYKKVLFLISKCNTRESQVFRPIRPSSWYYPRYNISHPHSITRGN